MHDERDAWPKAVQLEAASAMKLHELILRAGRMRQQWSRRAAGLLYQAMQADLPRQKGYRDIYHYAAVLAGFSRSQVSIFLRVGRAVETAPALRALFIEGTVPCSRFLPILGMVSAARDSALAQMIQHMTKRELEAYARGTGHLQQTGPTGSVALPADAARESRSPNRSCDHDSASASFGLTASSEPVGDAALEGVQECALDITVTPGSAGTPFPQTGKHESIVCQVAQGSMSRRATEDERSIDGDGPSPERARLNVEIDRLTMHRLRMFQAELSPAHGPEMGLGAVIDWVVERCGNGAGKPLSYVEVVVRDAATSKAFVRTSLGPRIVNDEELARYVRKGRPMNIDEEHLHLTSDDDGGRANTGTSSRTDTGPTSEGLFSPDGAPTTDSSDTPRTCEVAVDERKPEPHLPEAQPTSEPNSDIASAAPSPRPDHSGSVLTPEIDHGTARHTRGSDETQLTDRELRRPPSRYIPARTRRFVRARDGGLCAFPDCLRAARILHHVHRFRLEARHFVDDIVSVCQEHHGLLHHGLVANEDGPTAGWTLRAPETPAPDDDRAAIDRLVMKHRRSGSHRFS